MKIDTDEWMPLSEACKVGEFSQSTGYRLAKSLGIIQVVFGVRIVKKKDVETMKANRKPLGNPTWIASYDKASEAARLAVKSRIKRIKSRGITAAEKKRNKRLADFGRAAAKRS